MRLGTWNCRQRIDDKIDAIEELACDVLVVPECARRPALAASDGVSFAWHGDYEPKGLGVFGFNGWTLAQLEGPAQPWCLPLRLEHPSLSLELLLLAVWTVKSSGDGRPSYGLQFRETIELWRPLLESETVIIAGDLNASPQGPSSKVHLQNVEMLAGLGYASAIHHGRDFGHGEESDMTLRWIGRGRVPYYFHCDYIFMQQRLLAVTSEARIGDMARWVESGRSDHCPVTVTLDLDAL